MEAKELRIGNYVHYHIVDNLDERKEWYEVNEVDIDDIYTVLMGKADNLSPIPLTEDWLLKFGFKKYKNLPVFTKRTKVKDNFIIGNPEMVLICNPHQRIIWIESNTIHIKCAYVHQLQNLYFALTGKELIKKK